MIQMNKYESQIASLVYQCNSAMKSIDKKAYAFLEWIPYQYLTFSAESAFERATLPRGIEEKLSKVDWSVRDVLVGALGKKEQLDVCLAHKFYHVPAKRFKDEDLPIRYVAIYQSAKLFGINSGIRYYGEVIRCVPVKRRDIYEIPKDSDEEYYRFEVKEWKRLKKPIAVKEMGFVTKKTNLFLLEHSAEVPELWIETGEQYRLYTELRRAVNSIEINDSDVGFSFNDATVLFDDGDIFVHKNGKLCAKYEVKDFNRHPNAVFRQIQKEVSVSGGDEHE